MTGGAHVLTVEGDTGDRVSFSGGWWTKTGTFSDGSGTFDRYVLGDAEVDVEQSVGVSFNLSDLDGDSGFTLNGVSANDQSGFSVASAGDLNGDGFADLVIGARYANAKGASYVVFGQASGFAADLELSPETLTALNKQPGPVCREPAPPPASVIREERKRWNTPQPPAPHNPVSRKQETMPLPPGLSSVSGGVGGP